jgi:predicted phosphodiesterase
MKKHVLFILATLFIASTLKAQQSDAFLVKPYLQYSTKTSMVVLWETDKLSTGVVQYGKARFNVDDAVLDLEVISQDIKQLHEVTLTDLEPETNYFWKVVGQTESGEVYESDLFSFKTKVNDESAYTFALIGDTQINSRTPEFFAPGHSLMSRYPMYTVLGNHENDAQYYYDYMANPEPEYYYTFTYGNAQFFMIDSNRDVEEGSEQYNWLEWELAKSDAMWKFVVHHHPPYSSEENDHGDANYAASTMGTHTRNLVPLYEKYGVDFNLFGHTHVYERTWPLKEEMVNQKEGVIYINSGGAGGFIEDFAPTRNWFTAELQKGHHYVTFSIHDGTLVFKAIDHEGRLFDTIQLTKEEGEGTSTVVEPPAPRIRPLVSVFEEELTISIEAAFEDLTIVYTTDGSEPTLSSTQYEGPFTIDESATIRTRAYNDQKFLSRVNGSSFRKLDPIAGVDANSLSLSPGLTLHYYEEEISSLLQNSNPFKTQPVRTEVAKDIDFDSIERREDRFGLEYKGYILVKNPGRYTFSTVSDDGSVLYIHDQLIVDNDGDHGMRERSGEIILEAGYHPIHIQMFEMAGGQGLEVYYQGPDSRMAGSESAMELPAPALFHQP